MIANIGNCSKELCPTYTNEADTLTTGRAEWTGIQRGNFEFEITMTYGWQDAIPQQPARVAGFKVRIDETPWIVARVRHSLDASGKYISHLTLETEQADGAEGHEGTVSDEQTSGSVER